MAAVFVLVCVCVCAVRPRRICTLNSAKTVEIEYSAAEGANDSVFASRREGDREEIIWKTSENPETDKRVNTALFSSSGFRSF